MSKGRDVLHHGRANWQIKRCFLLVLFGLLYFDATMAQSMLDQKAKAGGVGRRIVNDRGSCNTTRVAGVAFAVPNSLQSKIKLFRLSLRSEERPRACQELVWVARLRDDWGLHRFSEEEFRNLVILFLNPLEQSVFLAREGCLRPEKCVFDTSSIHLVHLSRRCQPSIIAPPR